MPSAAATTTQLELEPESLQEEASVSLIPQPPGSSAAAQPPPPRSYSLAFKSSWVVNVFLLLAKIVAYAATGSKAVLASLADSAVDLASQLVISVSEHLMKQRSDQYPIGRARLEALGVIGCACIMSMASVEVVQYSLADLWRGVASGQPPRIEAGWVMYAILGSGTAAKLALFFYCRRFTESDSVAALAEDHLNDVWSNLAAMAGASVAAHARRLWWVDPVGAVLISLVILARWAAITWEQFKKVLGFTAPPEFIEQVTTLAVAHSRLLQVDCIRAYHFGARYNVELEIVLPSDMTVRESHDLSLDLQHKIEALDKTERAFVHCDYAQRDVPEHKVERTLLADQLKRRGHRLDGDAGGGLEMAGSQRQHLVNAV